MEYMFPLKATNAKKKKMKQIKQISEELDVFSWNLLCMHLCLKGNNFFPKFRCIII
jgi:hypothetical protein